MCWGRYRVFNVVDREGEYGRMAEKMCFMGA